MNKSLIIKDDMIRYLIFSTWKYVDIITYDYFQDTDEIYVLTKNDGEFIISNGDYSEFLTIIKEI